LSSEYPGRSLADLKNSEFQSTNPHRIVRYQDIGGSTRLASQFANGFRVYAARKIRQQHCNNERVDAPRNEHAYATDFSLPLFDQ